MDPHDTQHEQRMGSGYGNLALALVLSLLVMYLQHRKDSASVDHAA